MSQFQITHTPSYPISFSLYHYISLAIHVNRGSTTLPSENIELMYINNPTLESCGIYANLNRDPVEYYVFSIGI